MHNKNTQIPVVNTTSVQFHQNTVKMTANISVKFTVSAWYSAENCAEATGSKYRNRFNMDVCLGILK